MKAETKKVIEDLKRAGFDTTGIERQIQADPLLDKAGDMILGDGILRQSKFTQYMQATDRREQELQETAQKLATLHDASKTTTLPQDTLAVIESLEQALIGTGMFTEESVKEVSYAGKKPLIDLISKPNKDNLNNDPPPNKDKTMNNNEIDLSKYIDIDTHRKSLGNVAFGSIATNLELSAAIEEIKSLGIPVTRDKIKILQDKLQEGFNKGEADLDIILDGVFEVNKARQAKATIDYDAKVKEEVSKQVAEALKESGAPNRVRRLMGRNAPVFDRKRPAFVDSTKAEGNNGNPYKDDKGNIDVSKLPKNKEGDPLLFTARGDRESRVSKATDSFIDIEEKISQDPLYDY